MKTIGKFVAGIRQNMFAARINREIFDRIFPHLEREKDHGYPFSTDQQMNAQTEALDVQTLLDAIEQQTHRMPKSYGESFRHIMHRDLHERLSMYEQVARRRIQSTCDPRFVASRA